MSNTPSYSEIVSISDGFQRSTNLSYDLGDINIINRFIPTKASVEIIGRYLQLVLNKGADRANLLIGPYGKGKSTAVFICLSIVTCDGKRCDNALRSLSERVREVDPTVANLIIEVLNKKIHLLPIIINDRYLDVKQAFLASLKQSLSSMEIAELMPDNYFSRCLETINRWKTEYQDTYKAYKKYINEHHGNIDLEKELRQFNYAALTQFQDCYRAILSGAEFDPLLESDVATLYTNVAKALKDKGLYDGLFVVFDEFGKYLERSATKRDIDFKVLQDLAEASSRSAQDNPLLLTCITHKAISEYSNQLSSVQKTSFKTIEGRFATIYFSDSFEGSFSLVAGAFGKAKRKFGQFYKTYDTEFEKVINECDALGCFSGYESSVETIVKQSFPLHPFTALTLMKLSEHAAQNERTLFTFLSDPASPLREFIANNNGEFHLATVDMIYDYFHTTIRESSYDNDVKDLIIYTDSILPSLSKDESDLIRAISLFTIIPDNCLLATKAVLSAALQWDSDKFSNTAKGLQASHIIYTRRSDGVYCLMRTQTENIRKDIEHQVSVRHNRIDIADMLEEIRDPGYSIPRRYNALHDMVRFFQNIYVSEKKFFAINKASAFDGKGIADGYVIYLLGNPEAKDVQDQLRKWKADHIVVVIPNVNFDSAGYIEECSAIRLLMNQTHDKVSNDELGYYYDDMLQVVNQSFSDMFGGKKTCITTSQITLEDSIGHKISDICDNLYPSALRVRHEMINRNTISPMMRTAREKAIEAILNNDDYLNEFNWKTAENAILYATLSDTKDPLFIEVQKRIQEYLKKCEKKRIAFSEIMNELTESPFGLRRGIIPLIFAYAIRNLNGQITIYNQNKELPVNGDTLNAIDSHDSDFFILIDKGSASQQEYLNTLRKAFVPNNDNATVKDILDVIAKTVRDLPRCARANKRELLANDKKVMDISEETIEIRNLLLRYDPNPRDVIIEKFPKVIGFPKLGEEAAEKIIRVIKYLTEYYPQLESRLKKVFIDRLSHNNNHSLRGAMTYWLQQRSAAQLNHIYESSAMAVINVIRNEDSHSDMEWLNMLAVALTGLPVVDWGDNQINTITELWDNVLTEIESIEEGETSDEVASSVPGIQINLGGRSIRQPLKESELEGITRVAYETLLGDLSEFGESMSTEEKLLVLANVILHMNDR